jgi:hypothetical protein
MDFWEFPLPDDAMPIAGRKPPVALRVAGDKAGAE